MIPDFTNIELASIREMLSQRYQKDVEIHLADSEILLSAEAPQPAVCPTVFWHARGANFVVVKTGMFQYRTQFFYNPHDQYGTNIDQYNDLDECVAAVLQTQSDHEREREGVGSGSTGETLQ